MGRGISLAANHSLQAQLEGTENHISAERVRFNEAVKAYDTAVQSFPAAPYDYEVRTGNAGDRATVRAAVSFRDRLRVHGHG
ncbi:MAG: LemA family protein [Limisphaerales bacterium]